MDPDKEIVNVEGYHSLWSTSNKGIKNTIFTNRKVCEVIKNKNVNEIIKPMLMLKELSKML